MIENRPAALLADPAYFTLPTRRSTPGLGAETPIELFLIQALARENLFPQSQMLIMEDGGTFPAWYHLWNDPKFRKRTGLVTQADLHFPLTAAHGGAVGR